MVVHNGGPKVLIIAPIPVAFLAYWELNKLSISSFSYYQNSTRSIGYTCIRVVKGCLPSLSNNFPPSAPGKYCSFEVIAVNADRPRPRGVLDDVDIGWPLVIPRMIILTHNIAPVHDSFTPPVFIIIIGLQNA